MAPLLLLIYCFDATTAFMVNQPPKVAETMMAMNNMNRRDAIIATVATSTSFLVNPFTAWAADNDQVTLHIVDYPKTGSCGQVETTEKKAFFAKKFGGLKDGECSVEGYTSSEGKENGTNDKDKDKEYSIFGKE